MKPIAIILVTVIAAVCFFPLYFMISASFQHLSTLMIMPPPLIPYRPTLANYASMVNRWLPRSAVNTGVLGTVMIAASLAVSVSAAYGIAVHRQRWATPILVIPIFLPMITLIIPQFVVALRFYQLPDWLAAIMPQLLCVPGILLFTVYYGTIPWTLIEAARCEGARELTILARIIMPLSRPVVIYNIVSQFIGFSTNTVWQIITLSSDTRQTVLVNLYNFVMQSYFGAGNGMGRKLAAGSMLLVPPLVVYFIFAKYITSLSLAYRMEDK